MRPNPSTERGGPSLLVPQTSFLGDVVLTTPLLTALRRRLHPRRLTVLVRPEARALVEGHPDVDSVLIDDKYGSDRGLRGLLAVAGRLRREGFDLAVCPHRSLRTALVLAAAGIPRRVGFDASRGAWLFHERVHRAPGRHDVERNLALLEPWGGPGDEAPTLHVPVAEVAARRAVELCPPGAGPLVGVAPGSVWPTKRWTEDGFAAVVRELVGGGMRCVLLGAPADVETAAAIARAAGAPVINLAGRTDLATLVALIDRLDVLIGNDSAPMHVAAARNVPVVAIFCATTPAQGYGPWGPGSLVVESELACRPCGRHGGRSCPRATEDCRHLVRASAVLAAAYRCLARTAALQVPR
jgi:heptosyltransferase-2